MKFFSILNKPANKAGNKQAGLVFLEYVIMAFIITVAVICALWWFYWHLQQMTWEVKQKLETLKTLNCELGKPGGPESVQPTPSNGNGEPVSELFDIVPGIFTVDSPYQYQTVTIQNNGGIPLDVVVDVGPVYSPSIPPFSTWSTPLPGITPYGGPPPTPYQTVVHVLDGDPAGSFTVTVNPG